MTDVSISRIRCLLGVILFTGVTVPQLGRYYYFVPGPDNARQMEAAYNIVHGRGYTALKDEWSSFLNDAPIFQHVIEFPPGVSILLSMLLFTGLTPATAMGALEVSVLALGSYGWTLVGTKLFSKFAVFTAFILLVAVNWGPTRIGNSVSDSCLWAVFPFWLLSWWDVDKKATKPSIAAITTSFAILMRFQALSLLFANVFLSIYAGPERRFRHLLQTTLPGVCIAIAIFGTNIAFSGKASFVDRGLTSSSLHWDRLFTSVPVEFVFFRPTGLSWLHSKAIQYFSESSFSLMAFVSLISVAVSAAGGGYVTFVFFLKYRTNIAWPAVSAGLLSVFLLAVLALFYNEHRPNGWTFLNDHRYYLWLLPLGAAATLVAVEQASSCVNQVISIAIWAAVIAVTIFSTTSWTRYSIGIWCNKAESIATYRLYDCLRELICGEERLSIISDAPWRWRSEGFEAYDLNKFLADNLITEESINRVKGLEKGRRILVLIDYKLPANERNESAAAGFARIFGLQPALRCSTDEHVLYVLKNAAI